MLPYVSVIMPIHNEADFIRLSLGAVLSQDYPAERMEILAVDGESTDGTPELVRELTQSSAVPLRLIRNPGQIVPTGLNMALSQARGEIIVRVDGHTRVAPDYVRQCVDVASTHRRGKRGWAHECAGARALWQGGGRGHQPRLSALAAGASMFQRRKNGWIRFTWAPGRGGSSRRWACSMKNWCATRTMNSITGCAGRAARSCSTPRSNPNTPCAAPRWRLWRQYFQYGFWKVRVLQKHPLQMSPRQFAPPALRAGAALFRAAGLALLIRPLDAASCRPGPCRGPACAGHPRCCI